VQKKKNKKNKSNLSRSVAEENGEIKLKDVISVTSDTLKKKKD